MAGAFHILIADDDADDRLIIREVIGEISNSILISEVSNGRELVELMKRQRKQKTKPHAIILDINMPLMDGTDALRMLKAQGLVGDIPVFILSTMRNAHRVNEAIAEGVKASYSKPSTIDGFHKIMKGIVEQSFMG